MDNFSIKELTKLAEKAIRVNMLSYERNKKWRQSHPEEYKANQQVYMKKYNARKREEKLSENPQK